MASLDAESAYWNSSLAKCYLSVRPINTYITLSKCCKYCRKLEIFCALSQLLISFALGILTTLISMCCSQQLLQLDLILCSTFLPHLHSASTTLHLFRIEYITIHIWDSVLLFFYIWFLFLVLIQSLMQRK